MLFRHQYGRLFQTERAGWVRERDDEERGRSRESMELKWLEAYL